MLSQIRLPSPCHSIGVPANVAGAIADLAASFDVQRAAGELPTQRSLLLAHMSQHAYSGHAGRTGLHAEETDGVAHLPAASMRSVPPPYLPTSSSALLLAHVEPVPVTVTEPIEPA